MGPRGVVAGTGRTGEERRGRGGGYGDPAAARADGGLLYWAGQGGGAPRDHRLRALSWAERGEDGRPRAAARRAAQRVPERADETVYHDV